MMTTLKSGLSTCCDGNTLLRAQVEELDWAEHERIMRRAFFFLKLDQRQQHTWKKQQNNPQIPLSKRFRKK